MNECKVHVMHHHLNKLMTLLLFQRPIHDAFVTSGQKHSEGRSHNLPKPWPVWIGHVTTVGSRIKSTGKIRHSKRHPRTRVASNPGATTNLGGGRVVKGRFLKNSKGYRFHVELMKYLQAGCTRPPHGFPSGSMNVVVLYDGLVPIDQVGHVYRGYHYNWNIKGALVFGKIIKNVRGVGGHALQSGTMPLSRWGLMNTEHKLVDELKRRIPDRLSA